MTAKDTIPWYLEAVVYEVPVKSFCDSNGDGIGDFKGLTSRLDYLQSLGVTSLWILPFYPSPMKDDGYDIADYYDVHPDYGTLRDFKEFLKEAHARNIKVITELVLNHTSDQHSWFQRARKAEKGSKWRDYYVWSDTADLYQDARIIFKDFESSNWSWDPVAKAYYWHRFYSHQPDLNFDNPDVHKALFRIVDFWFGLGVDGMRLDAIPYLYERDGTSCENLPEGHAFLQKLRVHIDANFNNRMLLAEANQWPDDAVAYFGKGNECHLAFHFPVMPRLFMAIRMEDRFPILDILEQTPMPPEGCQWAMFLRNHDELTLEMVTDEERDYMYRVYAEDPRARLNLGIRRRLAPLLENNRERIELMNILLLSLPGVPVIYYGDELGMGDNYYLGDRNGVRTPMQWNNDRNAGFSAANPHMLYLPLIIDPLYHHQAVNVENQEANPSSLLWWMRRAITMRQKYRAFGLGKLVVIPSDNPRVLSFVREFEDEKILVVINLSRFSQSVKLEMKGYEGTPVEVFSQNRFFPIHNDLYDLTLGPHGHYWLHLVEEKDKERLNIDQLPSLSLREHWKEVLHQPAKRVLEQDVLPEYVKGCRWFGEKSQEMRSIGIVDVIDLGEEVISVIEVVFYRDMPSRYLLPLSTVSKEKSQLLAKEMPQALIVNMQVGGEERVLVDAAYDEQFHKQLLLKFCRGSRIKCLEGTVQFSKGKRFKEFCRTDDLPEASKALSDQQTNTSVRYNSNLYLKIYRRFHAGLNPEVEICRYLTDQQNFENVPPYLGEINLKADQHGSGFSLALLQQWMPSEGNGWSYMRNHLRGYYDRILSRTDVWQSVVLSDNQLGTLAFADIPELMQNLVSVSILEFALNLGRRTAQLHRALAANHSKADFSPEPLSLLYQKAMYHAMRSLTRKVLQALQQQKHRFTDPMKERIEKILGAERDILVRFQRLVDRKLGGKKIRVHGDFHLGQILYTGRDFVIIDFEGEPARPLSERKLKRPPFYDVAGMIRSFHYAAISDLVQHPSLKREEIDALKPWGNLWYRCMKGQFLDGYFAESSGNPVRLFPDHEKQQSTLLDVLVLEKMIYEVGYELDHRPEWLEIPLDGLVAYVEQCRKEGETHES